MYFHKKKSAMEKETNPFVCEFCGKTFADQQTFANHEKKNNCPKQQELLRQYISGGVFYYRI